jgi:3-hydroxyisobutyrate dehydrogenase-like beta-hydroxyacid dehydrogenase
VIRSDAREHAAMTTGFLHPGAMGSSLAQTCSGRRIWVSTDRSPETRARAERAGIDDVGSLESLVAEADTIVSICPPDQAPAVARSVAEHGFDGVYVDANAISPATARAVGASFGRFVDGGVIGPPVDRAGTTRLYLSGAEASRVAARWEHSALDVRIIDGGPGAASALKMCYAAWTKGTAALLLAVNALPVWGCPSRPSLREAPGRWCWSRWSARSAARTNDLDHPEGWCRLAMGRSAVA